MSQKNERGIGLVCFLGRDRNEIAINHLADFGGDVSPFTVEEIDFLKLKRLKASERIQRLQELVERYHSLLFVGLSDAEFRFIGPVIRQLTELASIAHTTISRIPDGSALLTKGVTGEA